MDRGLFLLLAASAIWSTTPIFAKMAYAQGLSPTLLIESRLLLGFFFLLLFNGNALKDVKSNIQNLVLLAIFGLAANYFFYHAGLAYTTASGAQLLESLSPVFVLLLNLALKEEYISSKKAAGVFITAMGSMLIFYSHSSSPKLVFGDALELLAALTWGYFIVQGSRVMRSTSPMSALSFLFGFSSLLFLPLAISAPPSTSLNALGIAFTMGFLHTFLAYILYFEGIKQTNPSSAGVVFALSPIITILLEGRILGLLSAPIFYMGGVLVISGAITVITQRR